MEKRILDSVNRREFDSGAVRDIHDGKGRCDLLPLDVVSVLLDDAIYYHLDMFGKTGDVKYLYGAIYEAVSEVEIFDSLETTMLEVSKHFEEGAKKYSEDNWKKGIPVHCYIDSATRHYLKHRRGDVDEPHDRAFVWNVMCAIWTVLHKPDLNDFMSI